MTRLRFPFLALLALPLMSAPRAGPVAPAAPRGGLSSPAEPDLPNRWATFPLPAKDTPLDLAALRTLVQAPYLVFSIHGQRIGELARAPSGSARAIVLRELPPQGGAERTTPGQAEIHDDGRFCLRLDGRNETLCFRPVRRKGQLYFPVVGAPAHKPAMLVQPSDTPTALTPPPLPLRTGEVPLARHEVQQLLAGNRLRLDDAARGTVTLELAEADGELIVTTAGGEAAGPAPQRQTGRYSIAPDGRYCQVLDDGGAIRCGRIVRQGAAHFIAWDDAADSRARLDVVR